MPRIEVNTHAEKIKEQVFHTFPYNMLVPNFKGPHADDCPGCIIEAELQILVDKIAELSPVEDIIAKLETAENVIKTLKSDNSRAHDIAGVIERGQVDSLVRDIVEERDRLSDLFVEVSKDLKALVRKVENG